MFSEYASRFLAQSNSRLPSQNPDNASPSRNPGVAGGRGNQRPFSRNNMPGPYSQQNAAQQSRFPFGSRAPAAPAPLFYSATDEFRDENDDEEEHRRDVEDLYALQRSRRAFPPSHLTESSEGDEDLYQSSRADDTDLGEESRAAGRDAPFRRPRGRGIRSSWEGEKKDQPRKPKAQRPADLARQTSVPDSEASTHTRSNKDRLVDVELSSEEHSSIDALDDEEEIYSEYDEASPPETFQFKPSQLLRNSAQDQSWTPNEADEEASRLYPKPADSGLPTLEEEEEGVEEDEELEESTSGPRHDAIWSSFYCICLAALFATAFLVYLNTNEPSLKNPLGDTIYATLRKSFHLLAVDTVIAIIVAAVWLTLLRNALRPLTWLIVFSVPVILFAFTLWPFIASFQGTWKGNSTQDKMMRIFSAIPLVGSLLWTYFVIQSRHTIDRAIQILELASKVLAASPALFMAGVAALAATVVWFWLWLGMFSRVFLEGHFVKKLFIIDTGTWWLAVFYILMLLWTQMIIAGIQRATTAATVSQWYFYRHSQSTSTSRDVVLASFNHATSTLFGTICLSAMVDLLIRLPMLLLPRRFSGWFTLVVYRIIPAPLASVTDPLVITYAAIHSQPLAPASRGLRLLPLASSPSRILRGNYAKQSDGLAAYRTTHALLHATRQIMTLALGLGAWVSTARYTQLSGAGYTGSLYAYLVGMGAAVMGWYVLGAVEGIVGGVVDAILVCWGSEMAVDNQARTTYCPEAGAVFGGVGLQQRTRGMV